MSLRKSGAILGLSVGLLAGCAAEREPSTIEQRLNASSLAQSQTFETADYTTANEQIVVLSDMAEAAAIADSPDLFRTQAATECDFTNTFYQVDAPTEVSIDIDGAQLELTVAPNGYSLQDRAANMGRLVFEGTSQEVEFTAVNAFTSNVYVTDQRNFVEVTQDVSEPSEGFSVPSFGIRYLSPATDGSGIQKYFGLSSGYFLQPDGTTSDFSYGISKVTGDCRPTAE